MFRNIKSMIAAVVLQCVFSRAGLAYYVECRDPSRYISPEWTNGLVIDVKRDTVYERTWNVFVAKKWHSLKFDQKERFAVFYTTCTIGAMSRYDIHVNFYDDLTKKQLGWASHKPFRGGPGESSFYDLGDPYGTKDKSPK